MHAPRGKQKERVPAVKPFSFLVAVGCRRYVTKMHGELRKLSDNRPFIFFTIHMASGEQIRVPTVDHVAIAPNGRRGVVFADGGGTILITFLLISQITIDPQPEQAQKA